MTGVGSDKGISMSGRFKNAFSHKDVNVHFVGAWYVTFALLLHITDEQVLGTQFRPLGLYVEHTCYLAQLMG